MIPAEKWRLFESWFAGHARGRLVAAFHALYMEGHAEVAAAGAKGPVLVVSNHTAWHDPLVIITLGRHFGLDPYAMMNAKNLERLPFFRRVGAFGVDLESPRDGVRAMRYAADLLDRPGRIVWIFPQGKTCPITEPLDFRGGASHVAKLAHKAEEKTGHALTVVPMAVRYEHADDERPSAWVSFGPALSREQAEDPGAQKAAVMEGLSRIETRVRARDRGSFEPLFEARPSAMAGLAERFLAFFTR